MSRKITPKYQAVVSFFVLLSVFSTLFSIPRFSANADFAWTEQSASPQLAWKQVAISSDASRIYAIVDSSSETIYTSSDSGVTWSPITTVGSNNGLNKWTAIATTLGGETIVATASGDTLYRSTDYGASWTAYAIPGADNQWTAVTVSSDGTKILAVTGAGQIVSTNDINAADGAVWTVDTSHTDLWTTVTGSGDFTTSMIAAYGGSIQTSVNGSAYTVNGNPSSSHCWSYMGSASDAYVVAVGDCSNGYIYTSHNKGVDWNKHEDSDGNGSSGTGTWYSVQTSSSGQVMIAADHAGFIKISNDEGLTWQEQTTLGNKPWTYAAVSADGTKFVAVATGNKIFTGSFFTPPPTTTAPTIATSTPSDVGTSTITLNATVVSDGGASTTESGFNWGETLSYGNTASSSNAYGAGSIFSQALSGLTCAMTYHYQAYASNSAGTATSSDDIFTTNTCDVVGTSTDGTGTTTASSTDGTGTTTDPVGTSTDPVATTTPDTGSSTPSATTDDQVIASRQGTRHQVGIAGGVSGDSSDSSSTGSNGSVGSDTDTSCSLPANLRPGSEGPQVVKLQDMLNKFVAAGLTSNGTYGPATKDAVKSFQNKYADEILAPWGVTEATGVVSFTTRKKLNELSCGTTFPLSSVEQFLISKYKDNPTTITPEGTATSTNSDGSTTTVEVGATTPGANDTQSASVINAGTTGGIFQKIGNFFKNIF